jgi:hypothetical protein
MLLNILLAPPKVSKDWNPSSFLSSDFVEVPKTLWSCFKSSAGFWIETLTGDDFWSETLFSEEFDERMLMYLFWGPSLLFDAEGDRLLFPSVYFIGEPISG